MGFWQNNDLLPLQFGPQKAAPEQGGDYLQYGSNRMIEVFIDLASLTSSAQPVSLNTLFPSGYNTYVEKVEVEVDVASAGGTSFSVGLGYIPSAPTLATVTRNVESSTSSGVGTTAYSLSLPSITTISDTAFVSALVNASTNAAGDLVTLTAGSTSAGGYIGAQSTSTTHPNYITAKASGTYSAGSVRVRIFYRGYGTIFN